MLALIHFPQVKICRGLLITKVKHLPYSDLFILILQTIKSQPIKRVK